MSQYWTDIVNRLKPYVPGEQPRDQQYVKLNTNENPYPPSPRVVEAINGYDKNRLKLYPDPESTALREALAQSDSAAYLAYRVRDNHRAAHTATEYAEALAIVGCAADSLSSRRRPWEIEGNDLSLPEWRERVWKLLFAMPDNALPKPAVKPEAEAKPCTCNETDSSKALSQEHAGWCPAQHEEAEP